MIDTNGLSYEKCTNTKRLFCSKKGGGPCIAMKRVQHLLCHHRSRLVESICIHLCNELTQPCTEIRGDGSKLYESRWKRILFKYNSIRARLFNSHTLSERTNISLFNVNETSIRLWYKHKTGREEIIITLMQGRPTPQSISIATEPLNNHRNPPTDTQGYIYIVYCICLRF